MGDNYEGPEVTINVTFSEDLTAQIVCDNAENAIKEYKKLVEAFGEDDAAT